jgi:tungstate transport system ATP-binding protein
MSALLEVRDLLVRRENKPVVEVDHLPVDQGNVLAVVGPNGAGKTSLILAIAHLLKPERGQILFNGEEVSSRKELQYRRRIALVLQEPLLLSRSVYENAALGLQFRGVPKEEIVRRVDHWLERLEIAHLRDRRADKLSSGEAQRTSLARAFVLQPELLLLDEPFSALDSPTRRGLLEELHSILAETSTTTIMITHNLQEATQVSHHLAVIIGGKLRQTGTVEELRNSPASGEVAAFLQAQSWD